MTDVLGRWNLDIAAEYSAIMERTYEEYILHPQQKQVKKEQVLRVVIVKNQWPGLVFSTGSVSTPRVHRSYPVQPAFARL
jgi:hypothetical protein